MIGGGPAATDHDGTATDVAAAAEAFANAAFRPDDLIQLSCQVSADGLVTVAIRGDLDIATVDRTVRYVTDVIDSCDGPVIVDLSELAFCDACGLGALIRVNTYAGQMGRKLELTFLSSTGPDELLFRLTENSTLPDEQLLQQTLALTARESQVLLWISRGKSNREIGEILGISPRTVNKHLEQVFVKLGVENRAAAAARAVRSLAR